MHWPAATTMRALGFVRELMVRDAKVEALLRSDDRTMDGIYRAEMDDPQLCNAFGTSFWELTILRQRHWDHGVREEAEKLAGYVRS
jgi:nucleolar complex protein 3